MGMSGRGDFAVDRIARVMAHGCARDRDADVRMFWYKMRTIPIRKYRMPAILPVARTSPPIASDHTEPCALPQALSTLPRGACAEVHDLQGGAGDDALLVRLAALGFVTGESVRVLAHGPIGREPLLIQVGHARFALRRCEAERITVLQRADQGR